ncbi:MAG: hypothetical protein L3J21_12945, partial [Devosiaceae bacterium]|nr:hypothetical protein [Devosiaceae bacterium]
WSAHVIIKFFKTESMNEHKQARLLIHTVKEFTRKSITKNGNRATWIFLCVATPSAAVSMRLKTGRWSRSTLHN